MGLVDLAGLFVADVGVVELADLLGGDYRVVMAEYEEDGESGGETLEYLEIV